MAPISLTINPLTPPVTLSVSLYESRVVADATSPSGDFYVTLGLSEAQVTRLTALSGDQSDHALQEYTSDFERFFTGSYAEWFNQGRIPFALIHKEDEQLAAIIWIGPKPLPGNTNREGHWDTVAFRTYLPYRGKGITYPFVQFATSLYRSFFPEHHLWILVDAVNAPSLGLGRKLGFEEERREVIEGKERIVMVALPLSIR